MDFVQFQGVRFKSELLVRGHGEEKKVYLPYAVESREEGTRKTLDWDLEEVVKNSVMFCKVYTWDGERAVQAKHEAVSFSEMELLRFVSWLLVAHVLHRKRL